MPRNIWATDGAVRHGWQVTGPALAAAPLLARSNRATDCYEMSRGRAGLHGGVRIRIRAMGRQVIELIVAGRPRFPRLQWRPIPPILSSPSPFQTPMSENITHVKDADFENEVLKSDTPVLLDFWAEWCGPCKSIAPMLDDIAKEYAGRLKVVKVNIDENQKTPMTYGVRGIPTLMVFKGGKVEATQIGAVGKGQLTQLIDKTI